MASNALDIGGYDCKFVEDPPDALKCLICLSVTRDPQQHGDCGKVFCNSCITEHRKISNDCPHCRQQLSIFNDGKSAQEVKSLKVRCDNDCPWMDELRYLEGHLQKCEKALIPCPNQCQTGSNMVKISKRNLQNHILNKCPRRQIPCPKCGETGEYQERISSHLQTCPKAQVRCPNSSSCLNVIARCDIATHRSTCQYERVSCKYAEVGCKETPLRKVLKTHEEDDQLHLRITKEIVLKLNKKITTLNKKIASLENKKLFTFKVTNYKEKKQIKNKFFSPSFYTSPDGYKMCIRVDANGNGTGEGTHVSVFVCLMKGDNDDSLTWPFTGTVTFELLNQLEDENHYTSTLGPFPGDNEQTSGRVVKGERGIGGGRPQFIPNTELDCKPDNNYQYLKDDTLIFRVAVKVPDYKPWLECTT